MHFLPVLNQRHRRSIMVECSTNHTQSAVGATPRQAQGKTFDKLVSTVSAGWFRQAQPPQPAQPPSLNHKSPFVIRKSKIKKSKLLSSKKQQRRTTMVRLCLE
jgi:hypothetical protein